MLEQMQGRWSSKLYTHEIPPTVYTAALQQHSKGHVLVGVGNGNIVTWVMMFCNETAIQPKGPGKQNETVQGCGPWIGAWPWPPAQHSNSTARTGTLVFLGTCPGRTHPHILLLCNVP